MEMTFRNAAFGGFNRQDVMDYIANAARESGEKIASLERERDALQGKAARKEQLEEELRLATETSASLEASLAAVSAERDALKTQTQQLKNQAEALKELEAQAQEYGSLKQHIAEIELDAHKRADQILQEAQAQADAIVREAEGRALAVRQTTEAELSALSERYQELLHAFETASSHVTGELRRMDVAVGQLPLAFNRMSGLLRELRQEAAGKEHITAICP